MTTGSPRCSTTRGGVTSVSPVRRDRGEPLHERCRPGCWARRRSIRTRFALGHWEACRTLSAASRSSASKAILRSLSKSARPNERHGPAPRGHVVRPARTPAEQARSASLREWSGRPDPTDPPHGPAGPGRGLRRASLRTRSVVRKRNVPARRTTQSTHRRQSDTSVRGRGCWPTGRARATCLGRAVKRPTLCDRPLRSRRRGPLGGRWDRAARPAGFPPVGRSASQLGSRTGSRTTLCHPNEFQPRLLASLVVTRTGDRPSRRRRADRTPGRDEGRVARRVDRVQRPRRNRNWKAPGFGVATTKTPPGNRLSAAAWRVSHGSIRCSMIWNITDRGVPTPCGPQDCARVVALVSNEPDLLAQEPAASRVHLDRLDLEPGLASQAANAPHAGPISRQPSQGHLPGHKVEFAALTFGLGSQSPN